MSILSGNEILNQYYLGNIEIDPFLPQNVGPNSLDVRLGGVLLEIVDEELDMSLPPANVLRHDIPRHGFLLKKGVGYLGSIVERVCCRGFVPYIDGRSTTGRYFVQTHQTAGRGDSGWDGCFTIELQAVHRPVRVYAGMPICQLTFHKVEGRDKPYQGRYNHQSGEPRLPSPLPRPEYPQ